jgi:hypothetical protein
VLHNDYYRYDVTGVPADRVEHVLRVDWDHLVKDKDILDSPYYLKERGQPVVAIWGFGFQEAHHDPNKVASIVRHIKSVTPGGAYVWGGGKSLSTLIIYSPKICHKYPRNGEHNRVTWTQIRHS